MKATFASEVAQRLGIPEPTVTDALRRVLDRHDFRRRFQRMILNETADLTLGEATFLGEQVVEMLLGTEPLVATRDERTKDDIRT